MTQEDKELLFKDLCARLPYGVIVQVKDWATLDAELKTGHIRLLQDDYMELKPYLRPMSSMTEEEKEGLLEAVVGKDGVKYFQVLSDGSIDNTDATIQDLNKFNMHWINFDKDTVTLYLDWLNSHHFDYRGLIEKGLAIEAPEGMYEH